VNDSRRGKIFGRGEAMKTQRKRKVKTPERIKKAIRELMRLGKGHRIFARERALRTPWSHWIVRELKEQKLVDYRGRDFYVLTDRAWENSQAKLLPDKLPWTRRQHSQNERGRQPRRPRADIR
jgi:hypothetical protein